ncbi:MAG: hypothetical protein O7C74_00310 [Acidobacteria bacterium]|nr:hypothetical protein [Acidobacteriota bacterium]
MIRRPPGGWLPAALILLLILVAVHGIYRKNLETTRLTFQARANLNLARSEKPFTEAVGEFRGTIPPLYASLLFAGGRLGIPPGWINELLLLLGLAALFLFSLREQSVIHPALPVALYGITHAAYAFGKILVSETLFITLALCILLVLRHTLQTDGMAWLVLLTLLCAAHFLTRYIGVFWLGPVVGLHLLLREGPLRRRILRTAAFSLAALAPLTAWVIRTYMKTGTLTGMDRFSDQRFQAGHARWEEMTDLPHNLWFTIKTFIMDLFSPTRTAYHFEVEKPFSAGLLEVLGLLLAAGAVIALLWMERRRTREQVKGNIAADSFKVRLLALHRRSATFLIVEFIGAFLLALMVLWTVGNNDPIYTRFLLPTYALIILLLVQLLDGAVRRGAPLPAQALLVGLLVVLATAQGIKTVRPPLDPDTRQSRGSSINR